MEGSPINEKEINPLIQNIIDAYINQICPKFKNNKA